MSDHQRSKPELRELVLYSDKIAKYWNEFALQLSLSSEAVNRIDVNHSDVRNKCFDMFKIWLERTPNPCWCQVVDAFKMVKLNEAAREIEKKFGT